MGRALQSLRTPARLLEAATRDAVRSNYKEMYELPNGDTILCESQGQRDWWENFSSALSSGQLKPEEFSIRDIFESIIPEGYSIHDNWRHGGNVSLIEAAGGVASGNFANISGQIVFTKVKAAYESEAFVFTHLIPTVHSEFNGERVPGFADLGDEAEIVNEFQPYPISVIGEDWIDLPVTIKRGNIVPVSKEAIYFDRTGQILQRCNVVGNRLGINKEKRAVNSVIDENTTKHRYNWRGTVYATYASSGGHGAVNLKASNGLTNWVQVDAAEQLFANMVDPNNGEPIVLNAAYLIVTPQNLNAARQTLMATGIVQAGGGFPTTGNVYQTAGPNPVNSGNPLSGSYQIAWSRQLAAQMATDTTWYLGDPTEACQYTENFPLTTASQGPNSKDEFERDVVAQFKASERGAYAVIEPRKLVKCTA